MHQKRPFNHGLLGAILKAITNHHILVPDHPNFIKAMLQWTWMFYDEERITEDEQYVKPAGEKVMQRHSERSEKIKKMEARFAKKYQNLGKAEDK